MNKGNDYLIIEVLLSSYKKIGKRLKIGNASIHMKIIGTFVILIIVPLIIYYVIFGVYSNNAKNKEIQLVDQLNKQAVDSVNSYVNDIIQLTMQPLYNNDILSILRKINNNYNTFKDQKKSSFYEADEKNSYNENRIVLEDEDKEITNYVNSIKEYKRHIHSVFLFDENGDSLYYSLKNGQLDKAYNSYTESWFKQTKLLFGQPVVSGATAIPNILPHLPNKINYDFTVSRAIKDNNAIDVLGYISIFSDVSVLKNICTEIKSVNGERIIVLDSKNSIVYDIDENNISKNIADKSAGLALLKNKKLEIGNRMLEIEGKNYLLMVNNITSPDWKLVRIIPENTLYLSTESVQSKLIFIIILFTLISLIMSISISYGITKPLKKLIKSMKLIEKGDLSIRFKTKYNDEIGQLGNGFNNMIGEIERLINDVYITNIRKKEAELNALQAQINPHFIYNTLESIRMMAKINNEPDTAYMISILGNLLRYSIHTRNQVVSLKEEFEHLKNYIILQNHRFENKYELLIDIPEELYNIEIIKLVFQPIVENAIYYAYDSFEGKAVILITAYRRDEMIVFKVEDKGMGMTVKQLESLNESINDFTNGKKEKRGIGLRNVNERIKLYYGENYGVKISSKLKSGTIVKLEIPVKDII